MPHSSILYYLNRTILVCVEAQAVGKYVTVKMLAIPQRVCLRFFHAIFSQHLAPHHQEESFDLGKKCLISVVFSKTVTIKRSKNFERQK